MPFNFEAASQSGLTPGEIRAYLKTRGREKEADQYFSSKQNDDPGFFGGIAQDYERRVGNLSESVEAGARGQQTPLETGLQALGQGAGLGSDIIGRGISAVVPDAIEKPVMEGLGAVAAPLVKGFQNLEQNDPRAARNLGAIGNIAGFIPAAKGVQLGAKAAVPVAKSAANTAIQVGTKVGNTVAGAGAYAKGRIPKALSIFAGEGDDVIKAALANPAAADIGIKGGDAAIRQAVTKAGERSIGVRTSFIEAHAQAFRTLAGDSTRKLVNKAEIINDFRGLLNSQKVTLFKRKQNGPWELDFTTSKIKANPGEVTKIQATWDAIQKWNDWTLAGMNEFKQLVGKFTRFADESGIPAKSPTLGRFYFNVNQKIASRLPKAQQKEYLRMNKKFTETIELMDEMVEAFNSGDPFRKIANIFSKNNDSLRHIVDFYEKRTGHNVPAVVAGRELAMDRPASFGFLNPRSWIDLLISPEKQAKVITKIGNSRLNPTPNQIRVRRPRPGNP